MNVEVIHNSKMAEIVALEDVLKECPQVYLSLLHFQIPGVYVRAMFIPEGTVLTGKIHNHECVSVVAKGSISVQSGEGLQRLDAGWIGISKAGVKRAGYAHEDTTFITIHRTDETELDKIETYLVSETFEEFQRRLT